MRWPALDRAPGRVAVRGNGLAAGGRMAEGPPPVVWGMRTIAILAASREALPRQRGGGPVTEDDVGRTPRLARRRARGGWPASRAAACHKSGRGGVYGERAAASPGEGLVRGRE